MFSHSRFSTPGFTHCGETYCSSAGCNAGDSRAFGLVQLDFSGLFRPLSPQAPTNNVGSSSNWGHSVAQSHTRARYWWCIVDTVHPLLVNNCKSPLSEFNKTVCSLSRNILIRIILIVSDLLRNIRFMQPGFTLSQKVFWLSLVL